MASTYNIIDTISSSSGSNSESFVPVRRVKSLWNLPLDWCRRVDFVLSQWQSRAEMRKQLRQLEPHTLKDVGLTREQILVQAYKPFWIK